MQESKFKKLEILFCWGEFYSNGKLKQEGVVNQYRKEYDINGKLIRSSSQFNSLSDGVH